MNESRNEEATILTQLRENNDEIDSEAMILNSLGLLYKSRSPDKISLIKSAALLNAAITRQPDEEKYAEDLNNLCKHVLKCADAKLKHADLVGIAKDFGKALKSMRKNMIGNSTKIKEVSNYHESVSKQLSAEHRYIQAVETFQAKVTNWNKKIMSDISKKCIEIMGPPPCSFTLAGLGPLARNEATPYCTFKHLIVFENCDARDENSTDSNIKEYFRWYSVTFHLIVLNFQETRVTSIIPSLNFYDFVGERMHLLDGLIVHGETEESRPELIGSIKEMTHTLKSEHLPNEYKLGDTLTRTCFVDGDEAVYSEFCTKINKWQKQNKHQVVKRLRENYLNDFDLEFSLKQLIREGKYLQEITHQLIAIISALGFLYDCNEDSAFQIIENLRDRNILSNYAAHRLSHAVAVSYHVRLHETGKSEDALIFQKGQCWDKWNLYWLEKAIKQSSMTTSLIATIYLKLLLKKNIEDWKCSLLENETWSKIFTVFFLSIEKNVEGVGQISKAATHVKLPQADILAVHFLVKTYLNAEHKYRRLFFQFIYNSLGLGRHYSLPERLAWQCTKTHFKNRVIYEYRTMKDDWSRRFIFYNVTFIAFLACFFDTWIDIFNVWLIVFTFIST